jgi:hypothetical protein
MRAQSTDSRSSGRCVQRRALGVREAPDKVARVRVEAALLEQRHVETGVEHDTGRGARLGQHAQRLVGALGGAHAQIKGPERLARQQIGELAHLVQIAGAPMRVDGAETNALERAGVVRGQVRREQLHDLVGGRRVRAHRARRHETLPHARRHGAQRHAPRLAAKEAHGVVQLPARDESAQLLDKLFGNRGIRRLHSASQWCCGRRRRFRWLQWRWLRCDADWPTPRARWRRRFDEFRRRFRLLRSRHAHGASQRRRMKHRCERSTKKQQQHKKEKKKKKS